MRLACVQTDVAYGEPHTNTEAAIHWLQKLKHERVDLAVFPEAFLTGYCAGSVEEARCIALRYPDPSHLNVIRQSCDDLDIHAVVGFAEWEVDPEDGQSIHLYNSAALFTPHHPPRIYRKTHLPFLGFDRFAQPGHELPIFETRFGKIGVLICFDLRYPEATRAMALRGMDLLVLPTNWPEGAEVSADHIIIARAAENHIFCASCNRVGTENGFRFLGRSKIVNPNGQILAAGYANEDVIVADIDLVQARDKRRVVIPNEYETEIFAKRNESLYRS